MPSEQESLMQDVMQGGSSAMSRLRQSWLWKAAVGGVAIGLLLLAMGDGRAQVCPLPGIDPLEILNLQVKNNVIFVFDTSGSMKWPIAQDNFDIGGDDPLSRLYQAKQAVKLVVQANQSLLNYGLASYSILSSNKTVNRNQEFDSDGRMDGPFIYVSVDNTAATPFYQNFFCPPDGVTRDGFWCRTSDTFGNFDGTNSGDVFQSFQNRSGNSTNGNGFYDDPYPPPCNPFGPPATVVDTNHCHFYLQSKLFRTGVRYTWDLTSNNITTRLVGTTSIACPLPPAGLTGDNPDTTADGFADNPRACIEMEDQANPGVIARFFYSSAIFQSDANTSNCGGAAVLSNVAPCTGDNTPAVLAEMRQELPVAPGIANFSATNMPAPNTGGAAAAADDARGVDPVEPNGLPAGLRADHATPIEASLSDILNGPPVFPAKVINAQKNFVVFLTDGDDTCAGGTLDANATAAARTAEALYYNGCGGPGTQGPACNPPVGNAVGRNQAETFFVAFAASVNVARSDKIAQAGSGGNVQTGGTVTNPGNGVPFRKAFTAQTTGELVDVLNQALQLAALAGTFSASASTLGTVFELVPGVPGAFDPQDRYDTRVNILFFPVFDLPGWQGHLYAFRNDGTFQPVGQANFTGRWDAGETLFEKVSQFMEAQSRGGRPVNQFTFAELHDGATVENIRQSNALIKRRIFTSPGNGRFLRSVDAEWDSAAALGRNVVSLWPPNQTGLTNSANVDPAVGATALLAPGVSLDTALGIDTLTFEQLRDTFKACQASTDAGSGPKPVDCDEVANRPLATATALREARRIIIVFTAGAQLNLGTDNLPLRDASTSELLYRDRGWILDESTLSQPAVVTPPLRGTPAAHTREFVLFRDGRRDISRQGINEIDKGFGLRNPDFDDTNPSSKPDLKPVATVVYIGTNTMLHAFRAGPNCIDSDGDGVFNECPERGSEEVWGFVPPDQIGKLKELLDGQVRNPHTYVVSSSVRAAFVFVPGPFTLGANTFDGRWRTVILFGRGPGGKYYTALDVTAPGPFTRQSLDMNPPWVLWNRGNPDTVDGTPTGTPVRAADTAAYAKMGESWSVPAVGNIDLAAASAPGGPGLPEWRAFCGSGYSCNASEGSTAYALDVISGDVIDARDVGDGSGTFIANNSLVANATAYNPFLLDSPFAPNRSKDFVTRVFIPDVHGRIWKFAASSIGQFADEGPTQPFGDPVSLLKLPGPSGGETAFVFVAAGNDNRVAPPPQATPPFKMFGYRDDAGDTLSSPGVSILPSPSGGGIAFPSPFRGSSQPATFFNASGAGRVFFAGTRFNTLTASCVTSFDTILFALGAETGVAVYDFTGDGTADQYQIYMDVKDDIRAGGGKVIISDSGSLGRSPSPPPPSPTPSPFADQPAIVVTKSVAAGSPVCRQ